MFRIVWTWDATVASGLSWLSLSSMCPSLHGFFRCWKWMGWQKRRLAFQVLEIRTFFSLWNFQEKHCLIILAGEKHEVQISSLRHKETYLWSSKHNKHWLLPWQPYKSSSTWKCEASTVEVKPYPLILVFLCFMVVLVFISHVFRGLDLHADWILCRVRHRMRRLAFWAVFLS